MENSTQNSRVTRLQNSKNLQTFQNFFWFKCLLFLSIICLIIGLFWYSQGLSSDPGSNGSSGGIQTEFQISIIFLWTILFVFFGLISGTLSFILLRRNRKLISNETLDKTSNKNSQIKTRNLILQILPILQIFLFAFWLIYVVFMLISRNYYNFKFGSFEYIFVTNVNSLTYLFYLFVNPLVALISLILEFGNLQTEKKNLKLLEKLDSYEIQSKK